MICGASLPTIRRAAALVTDTGGMTCHAAQSWRASWVFRVSSAHGPRPEICTTGRRSQSTELIDGVLSGRVEATPAASVVERRAPAAPQIEVTGTKIYVNLAMPDTAEAVAAQGPEGVGLLWAEFMLTEALGGRHPRDLIARGEQKTLVNGMVASVGRIAAAFAPRPVVYRATDFRSSEFGGLRGGEAYEPVEHNPMIGYRGCYRYIKEPALFALDCRRWRDTRTEPERASDDSVCPDLVGA